MRRRRSGTSPSGSTTTRPPTSRTRAIILSTGAESSTPGRCVLLFPCPASRPALTLRVHPPLQYPDVPGLHSFKGPLVHSANWPESLDLAGKRVGLIGVGSTATQIIPAIQPEVAHLTAFVRSKTWVRNIGIVTIAPNAKIWSASNRSRLPLARSTLGPTARMCFTLPRRGRSGLKTGTSTTSALS